MGLGCIPGDHPLATGMIGMHGTKASNNAVQRADLILAIGARFSDRVISKADTFAPKAKILHIDIDPAEINKNVRSEYWIVGDIKAVLTRILAKLEGANSSPGKKAWDADVAKWRSIVPSAHSRETKLHPRFIMEAIHAKLGKDAIVATDVGQHQMWNRPVLSFSQPRTFLTSGGLGTMGYGMGAAVGAKCANPGRPVALITGDGSFRMNCGELGTANNYHLPILVVIVNNRVLGMVRQWQALFYDERYAETDPSGRRIS
jgi:acetolactate synthase-1/2/3 large subunit